MAVGTTNIGFEDKLWLAADKLRGSMDASEYKNVVLGLIFLKYVSDAFGGKYEELVREGSGFEEDKDEYTAENIFYVPMDARWETIESYATSPEIGKVIDNAMELLEKENSALKGVLSKNYARPELDKTRLGELVTLFTNIEVGTDIARERDVLGRVYEYFLGKFASAEGKLGGEFYTPSCIVRTLVEIIEPFKGRVFDPACGSGGMFCQSAKFVTEHQGNIRNISVYGQESNPTTWKLAKMNLALRQIDADLGTHNADSFHEDLHKSLKADFILANPPFNISDWGGERLQEDVRWRYGTPPVGNANYAWLQHMLHHLNPAGGVCGTVLANGSLSSNTSNEGNIRANMLRGDVVECIVAMPGQLFYSTGIPVCLWIMRKGKPETTKNKVLFIDARNLGHMIDRKVKELSEEDIMKIADTYHNWKNQNEYEDVKGFCKEATIEEIAENDYVLTPGRYVGIEEAEDDGVPFEEKMEKLTKEISEQFRESHELEDTEFPLTGILKCPMCGKGMTISRVVKKKADGTKKVLNYYACGAWKNKGTSVCKSNMIRIEKVHEHVFGKLSELFTNEKMIKAIVKNLNQERKTNIGPSKKQLEKIEKELEKLDAKKSKIFEAYEEDIITKEEFLKRKDELNETVDKLQRDKQQYLEVVVDDTNQEVSYELVKSILQNFNQLLENCETREKKKMLLQLIISEITINEEREIDSIRLKINDNVIEYMSKQDGVSIKGASSIFVHKNMGVPMINLKIAI